MGIFNNFHKKEKPVFTGIARGVGGFGFGGGGGGPTGPTVTSGGTIITDGSYTYHVFTTDDTFENSQSRDITFLLVGGGGGTGGEPPNGGYTGGGGSGGVAYAPSWPIAPGSYPVVVGPGGQSTFRNLADPTTRGSDTTFEGVTALGGGVGFIDAFSPEPQPFTPLISGGSGGGNGDDSVDGAGTGLQPAQPNHGGLVTNYGSPGNNPPSGNGPGDGSRGGAGGGAGGGGPITTDRIPGNDGQPFPVFPAPVLAPAIPAPLRSGWTSEVGPTGIFGGGGAGNNGPGSYASGGTGGGGDSRLSGYDYTGGGAGGGHPDNMPSPLPQGGKGIVIIRYLT